MPGRADQNYIKYIYIYIYKIKTIQNKHNKFITKRNALVVNHTERVGTILQKRKRKKKTFD